MSHYAVLGVRKEGNPISLDEAMERYDENREVEPYISKTYAELTAEGRDMVDRYKDMEEIKSILDGMPMKDWIAKHGREYSSEERNIETYKYYKEKADQIKAESAGTWGDKEYHDFAIDDSDELDEEGNRLSTYNPDSKWDWYVEGGRWPGQLKIKKSKVKEYGSSEVDSAKVGDVDWAAMNSLTDEQRERATRLWKYYVMEEPYPGTEEEKREELGFIFYKKEYYLNRYKTLEGYLKSLGTWCLRAVIDDNGDWHEVGEMGWFGCSSETEDEDAKWEEEFYDRFIKPLPKDAMITVLDCHI